MKQLSGKELVKLLESKGWKVLRVNGSHHILGKSGSVVRLSVPVHGNNPLKVGLLRHLMKMAEVDSV